MNFLITIPILLLGITLSQGQAVDLSGVVKDRYSGKSVAEAEVVLVGTEYKTSTDSDGQFRIRSLSNALEPMGRETEKANARFIPGRGIAFRIPVQGKATLRILDLNGAAATKSWERFLPMGGWRVKPGKLAVGAYVGSIQCGLHRESFSFMVLTPEAGDVAWQADAPGPAGLRKTGAGGEKGDSLRISKPGYFPVTRAVSSLIAAGLTVELSDSNSAESKLSGLVFSAGGLAPAFNGTVSEYTLSVASGVDSLTLNATPVYNQATLRVNGSPAAAGVPSVIHLGADSSRIQVDVTAQDGIAKRSYFISVGRLNSPPKLASSYSHSESKNYLIIGGRPVCCSSATGSITQDASDPEGDPLTFSWTVETGCGTITSGADTKTAQIEFCTSSAGISPMTLLLTVSDNKGNTVSKRFRY